MRTLHRILALASGFLLLTLPATAQTFTVHRPFGKGVSVELALPQIKTDPGEEITSLLITTTVHLAVGERSLLQISIPYQQYRYRYNYSSSWYNISSEGQDDGLMNLGLGFLSMPNENSAWEFHLTIPTISESNAGLGFNGVMTDFDRFESYLRKNLALGFYGNLLTSEQSAFVGRVRVGPTAWIPTGDSNDEAEATLDAALGVGVRIGPVEAGAYATTRTILTEDKLIGDKTIIHTTFSAQLTVDPLLLQVYYRLPQNDAFSRGLNGTLGIAVAVTW